MKKPKFIDLFAGIGGIRIAFELAGAECVYGCDSDPATVLVYERAFGHIDMRDIRSVKASDIPKHDILTGGFPCQPFSIIGSRRGAEDPRGQLFDEVVRIVRYQKPKAVVLENVKNLRSIENGSILASMQERLRSIGYRTQYRVLDARDFGLPQKRERTIIVGFRRDVAGEFSWPEPQPWTWNLADILDDGSDAPQVSDAMREKLRSAAIAADRNLFSPAIWHVNKSGIPSLNRFSCALRSNASRNYLTVDGVRLLSIREMARLQGFPEDFPWEGVTYTVARRTLGNSVAIPCIRAVAEKVLEVVNA